MAPPSLAELSAEPPASTVPFARRALVFFGACIGARLLLALVAAKVPPRWLPWLGAAALLPAAGFFYIYLARKNRVGAVFKEPAWWDPLRPLHGAMYLAFALLALARVPQAWVVLAADAALGAVAFLGHYAAPPHGA
jgi:hypothetical protein